MQREETPGVSSRFPLFPEFNRWFGAFGGSFRYNGPEVKLWTISKPAISSGMHEKNMA